MKLPDLGVSRPIATLMVFLSIILLGVIAFLLLPLDLMPKMEAPAVSIITSWPGAGTEDIEKRVTKKLENDLSVLSNLDDIQSTTKEGFSVINLKFIWNANITECVNEIRDKLEISKQFLPDDVKDPMIFKFDSSMMPIIIYGITAKQSYDKLYDIANDSVAIPIRRVKGVGAVKLIGGEQKQINVFLEKDKLESYKISPLEIDNALKMNNLSMPAGNIKIGDKEYLIRSLGEYLHPNEIGQTLLRRIGDANIYLKDVATIEDSFKTIKRKVRIDKEKALLLFIQKRSGTNTVDVVKKIKEKIGSLQSTLPADIGFSTLMDSSEFIQRSIHNLLRTILWGALFVCLITFLFLRNIRISLIIILTIPFAIISTFIFMYWLDWSVNIISLAALAIAIGMVVDNAVVVLDNTLRYTEKESVEIASKKGPSKVASAIIASTLTTIIVFLPLLFLSGIVGVMFKQLGGVVTITLSASLFCALLFTPMLCSKILRKEEKNLFPLLERFFHLLEEKYFSFLQYALSRKKYVIRWSLGLFVFSLMTFPFIGTEFMPAEDTGNLTVIFEMPQGTPVEKTKDICQRVEALIEKEVDQKYIERHFYHCGEPENNMGAAFNRREGANIGQIGCKLVSVEKRDFSTQSLAERIGRHIKNWPEIVKLDIDADNPMSKVLLGSAKPISLEIIGHDFAITEEIAHQIKKIAEDVKGTKDVTISREMAKPEIVIQTDREKALSLGLDLATLSTTMRLLFYGKQISTFHSAEHEYDIFMKIPSSQKRFLEDIKSTKIANRNGELIRLDNIATIDETLGPVEIERKNQQRLVKVEMDVFGRAQGEIIHDLRKKIAKSIVFPEGVSLEYGGLVKEQKQAFEYLFYMLLLAIVLVYMVLAAQFESFKNPFVIMFSIPFAFTGVFIALAVTRTTLSVLSFIGLIMLIGIVVNNAIVLIDRINQLSKEKDLIEAICTSGKQRLRPVLITTLTTICGMMPLIFSKGEGAEIWRPLGITVAGGLLVSTLVTLILIPTIYYYFNYKKASLKKFF